MSEQENGNLNGDTNSGDQQLPSDQQEWSLPHEHTAALPASDLPASDLPAMPCGGGIVILRDNVVWGVSARAL